MNPPTPPTPQRILVADDEHLMATGLTTSLAALGHAVIGPVSDGESAIDSARREPPDLAILDIRMPGIGGLEAAKILWEEMGIPTIIISAFSDPTYIEQAQETGVFGYLLKPVSSENLRVTLSIAWARAANQMDNAARISQLERTLAGRRAVEQAKWKLIEERGITEPEAHSMLQKAARNGRRSLAEVAGEVLTGEAAV
ncbi:MAG: response regulator [Phycisphaerales bacterium]|nr:response regulator [Phycisphaerales bacterium]